MTGKSTLTPPPPETGGHHLGAQTVQVLRTPAGGWEVLLPDGTGLTTCDTLSAARRIGRRWAEANPPSELIILDAYHRVVMRRSFGGSDAVS